MATITGVLLDVSISMKKSIEDGFNRGEGSWASSIFKLTGDLITHDVSFKHEIFAVGVGASTSGIMDVLWTLVEKGKLPASNETIECILNILENNGAVCIRKWVSNHVISSVVSNRMATLFSEKLKEDRNFARYVVLECLPSVCRTWKPHRFLSKSAANKVKGRFDSAASKVIQATKKDVKKVVEKAVAFVVDNFEYNYTYADPSNFLATDIKLQNVCFKQRIFNARQASEILHGAIGKDLSNKESRRLLKEIEPYIYGYTPLCTAIDMVSNLFKTRSEHKKLLFVLSDGLPTDGIFISHALEDVRVIGCFISRSSTIEPKRLYSKPEENWDEGAKLLFNLSSHIPTQLVTRVIFIKRGWKIDITDNETRLFLHVNHPDNLKEASVLARNVINCQDALSELLVSVDLDIYINQKNTSIRAHQQVGGTCYANASAAVLHLAMHRILGRHKPEFETLRDQMINRFGVDGANTLDVLKRICPEYRLQCRQVDTAGALEAIAAKRPVVARFRLTDDEWNTFGSFFQRNPQGILTKADLDISLRPPSSDTSGHAVVLTSYNSECLRLLNSWGENWADNGFFKIEYADVLGLNFIDVFWILDDLTFDEKAYYQSNGAEVAKKLMTLLKGLHAAQFSCPRCMISSLVTDFRGTISNAICPQCNHEFSSNDGDGNILALNVYLTSLSSLRTIPDNPPRTLRTEPDHPHGRQIFEAWT